MLWIGEKTERRLNEMGIRTIGDLARSDVSFLIDRFGVMGRRYHQWAHGVYASEVLEGKGVRKSLGHESTFAIDASERHLVIDRLNDICHRIHKRVMKRGLLFRTVTIKIRYGSFETHTRGKTLPLYTSRLEELLKTTLELVQRPLANDEKIRLIGVRVSGLKSAKGQKTLS
jgi:nucleotidyltransferase/DNA polymerase involved in DNA repair